MEHTDPYLPADALGISESHRDVLIRLARDLAANIIPASEWNMLDWSCCISGHMVKYGAKDLPVTFGTPFHRLFNPTYHGKPCDQITQPEAAKACYAFLTTGYPNWRDSLTATP